MTSDRSFNVAAPAIEAAAPGSKCAEVWNEMAVMHEESSRRRRLYERRREEGSWLTWGLSCSSSLPQLLMNAEQFFMHTWPRKNERLLCDRDSLISNTKAFVCHLGISLLYSSALLRLSTAAAAKGSSNKKRRTELKVVKNVAADWLQVATLLLASFI